MMTDTDPVWLAVSNQTPSTSKGKLDFFFHARSLLQFLVELQVTRGHVVVGPRRIYSAFTQRSKILNANFAMITESAVFVF